MSKSYRFWSLLACAALLAAGALGASVYAQQAEQEEGRVIRIGPDNPADRPAAADRLRDRARDFGFRGFPDRPAPPPEPLSPYFIGVAVEPVSDQLRAHVDIPEGEGLIITRVFDESPAAEAGLKLHDILLRADSKKLAEMKDLVAVVDSHGDADNSTQFTVDFLRRGQNETLWVTPAKRPEPPAIEEHGDLGPEELRGRLDDFRRGFGGFGGPMGGPNFDFFQRGFELDQVPNGVSISIERRNDAPPKVTVKRDGETWEVVGDDPKSLEALPEDLRPMVENMLNQPQPQPRDAFRPRFEARGDLETRLQEMEKQMQELHDQLRQQLEDR